jgi:hypothetical protein
MGVDVAKEGLARLGGQPSGMSKAIAAMQLVKEFLSNHRQIFCLIQL